nr:YfhE family protein [Pueribacillus theae]
MMTEKANGLSSTQEVIYPKDFKKADKAAKEEEKEQRR